MEKSLIEALTAQLIKDVILYLNGSYHWLSWLVLQFTRPVLISLDSHSFNQTFPGHSTFYAFVIATSDNKTPRVFFCVRLEDMVSYGLRKFKFEVKIISAKSSFSSLSRHQKMLILKSFAVSQIHCWLPKDLMRLFECKRLTCFALFCNAITSFPSYL